MPYASLPYGAIPDEEHATTTGAGFVPITTTTTAAPSTPGAGFVPISGGGGALGFLFFVTVVDNTTLTVSPIMANADGEVTSQTAWGVAVVSWDGTTVTTTPMEPGGWYVLEGTAHGIPFFLHFQVPVLVLDANGNVALSLLPDAKGNLASLIYAVGKELQYTGGAPTTRITHDCPPTQPVLQVGSTVGFPPQGELLIKGNPYNYHSKTPTSFTLTQDPLRPRVQTLGRELIVSSNTRTIRARTLE
jgi:hypothetical protein